MADTGSRTRLGKHWGKDAVIVAALLAAGFFAAWLRFRPYLGTHGSYTDGSTTYSELPVGELRYALWEGAEPVPGPVNSEAAESRPTVSPDGRWLVFAVGERGLNADLWIAELGAGPGGDTPGEPRPLAELNTGGDELAPAFGPDALYFAAERPGGAGGLDLWRASYRSGAFAEAEPLSGDVNTADNETDPALRPGSRELYFASDRRPADTGRVLKQRDMNLWVAVPVQAADEAGHALAWDVGALGELNTPFEEREPAFTADGRHLFFASDRDGGAGGYDLYRSARSGTGWSPPDPLSGVNSSGDERAPAPQADGFALWFAGMDAGVGNQASERTGEREPALDLWRARSVELFHLPGRPVGWWDMLVLVSLLVLALLAWLARHWESIDVLYKCFLVSVIAHFLLLLWLQRVHPDSEPMELPGRDALFTVRLASTSSSASDGRRERAGEVDVERAVAEAASAPARSAAAAAPSAALEAPSRFELSSAESAPAPAPAATEVEVARAETEPTPRADVAAPAESFERANEPAPEVALAAAALAVEAANRPSETTAEPARSQSTASPITGSGAAALAPSAAETLAAGAPAAASAPARAEVALEQSTHATTQTAVAVAAPTEQRERLDGAAPSLELAAAVSGAAAERASRAVAPSAAHRTASELGSVPSELAVSAPLASALPTPAAATGAAPLRATTQPERGAARAVDAPTRQPAESTASERGSGAAPAPPLALAPSAVGGAIERESGASQPVRTNTPSSATTASAGDAQVGPAAGGALAPATSRASNAPAPIEGEALTAALSAPRRVGPEGPSLRAPAPPTDPRRASGAAGAVPRALDLAPSALALSAPVPGRYAPSATPGSAPGPTSSPAGAPTRHAASPAAAPVLHERAPSAPLLEASTPTATAAADIGPRRDTELTPYRSRFGLEKQRALELHGGGEETERAVASGLEYLATIQHSKGYWGSPRDRDEKYGHVAVGKTGLCLLAFLAAGHTPESETQYSGVTSRAVDFLLDVQTRRKGHFGDTTSYSHGIATYALAECYALTGDEQLEAPLKRAVHHILSEQVRDGDRRFRGGWGYYYADNTTYDRWPRASVTAWQVMALESARLGGIPVPDSTFELAGEFLEGLWDDRRDAFRYNHDPGRLNSAYPILPGSTPASLFALSLLGRDIDGRDFREAVRFVSRRAPDEYRYRGDDAFVEDARGNLYFWYYGTLAMFRIGGDRWERWNAAMKETLLPSQEQNGSWEPISIYARYAGDDDADRSYTTAMCVLTLEVYYRYFTPLLTVESR